MAKGSQYAFDHISKGDFDKVRSQYDDVVPSKLAELEEQRLHTIPASLTARKKDGKAYLTKQEVATLVDWKLSHGKFRPSLKGLVQQNSNEFVEEITAAGFSEDSWSKSLDTLTKLRGIGPATAALLLSTHNPEELPFFSDELFLWAFWEDKTGGRWDRKIKYSLKEYKELVARIEELRKRLGKGALEAEKVAYVLGKRGEPLGEAESSIVHDGDVAGPKPVENKGKEGKPNKPNNAKRKTTENDSVDDQSLANKTAKHSKAANSSISSTSQRVTRSSKRNKGGAA